MRLFFKREFGGFSFTHKIIMACAINQIVFNVINIVVFDFSRVHSWYCYFDIVAWFVNLLLCLWVREVKWSRIYLVIYSLVSIGFGSYVSGGIYSCYLYWLPILIQGTNIFASKRYTLLCLVVGALIYILFMWLQLAGYVDFHGDAKGVSIWFSYTNFASSIIMIWVIYYYFLSKEQVTGMQKKEARRKVKYLQTKLSQKEQEMEKLRSDMAKDFHDEMGNKLASITIMAQSLAMQHTRAGNLITEIEEIRMLETIELRAQEMYRGTKDFIWSVDNRSDFVLELFIYLREFGEQFFNQIEMDFKSEYLLDPEMPYRLESLAGRQCVMICKEIMTNAAKYAESSDFIFEMSLLGHRLQIVLADHGKGFDKDLVEERGIAHVFQRSRQINAEVTLASDVHGTRYLMSLPLAR